MRFRRLCSQHGLQLAALLLRRSHRQERERAKQVAVASRSRFQAIWAKMRSKKRGETPKAMPKSPPIAKKKTRSPAEAMRKPWSAEPLQVCAFGSFSFSFLGIHQVTSTS